MILVTNLNSEHTVKQLYIYSISKSLGHLHVLSITHGRNSIENVYYVDTSESTFRKIFYSLIIGRTFWQVVKQLTTVL